MQRFISAIVRPFFGACLVAVLTAGLAAGQEAPANPLGQAIELQRSGDIEGAIRAYKAFLEEQPDNPIARANLGAALAQQGRYTEAIEQYGRALGIAGENPAIRLNLALSYFKSNRIPEAAAGFEKVLAAQPKHRQASLLLADCYLRMGENRKVVDLLTPLEPLLGDDRALFYLLGTALIRDNQLAKGQILIDKILRNGDSAEAHVMLGTASIVGNDFPTAVKELARAVELNPKLPSAHAFYARALMATGDAPRAFEEFRRELELNPNDYDSNLYAGVLLKQDQKFAEAVPYLEHALEIRPDAPEARYQISSAFVSLGKLTEAQSVLERLVKDEPSFVEAHVTLARVYYRLKRKEDGDREQEIVKRLNAEIQARQPGVRQEGTDGYRGAPAASLPGRPAQAGEKGTAEVLAATAKAPKQAAPKAEPVKLDPQTARPARKAPGRKTAPGRPDTFEQVSAEAAQAREADRIEESIGLYRKTLAMRPSWSEGWWYLGSLYYTADRYLEGRDAYRKLTALRPDGGPAWAMLGLCEYQLREFGEAYEHLERGRALGTGGNNTQLTRVTRFHVAVLLNRIGQPEAALQLLHALARDQAETPSLLEALGLAALALPYLPDEAPAGKRELIFKAGRAQFLTASRHLPEARKEFDELIASFPDERNTHYGLGVFLLSSNPDAALDLFRREIALFPDHLNARLQIAFEYLKRAEPESGLPFAAEAVKIDPKSFAARNAFGRLLLDAGRVNEAVAQLEAGIKLAPDSPEMAYALARAYTRAGRKEDAARARLEFERLDKMRRAITEGKGANGGVAAGAAKPPG